MALHNTIKQVLEEAQVSKACHQQKIKVLKQFYDKVPMETFFHELTHILKLVFQKKTSIYVEKTLEFLANFVAEVTPADADSNSEEEFDTFCLHPFLTMIIKETLRYHDLINESLRFNSCLFIKLVLNYLVHTNLDNEVCDLIQDAMLERACDPKSSVRLQAVLALHRLQDPYNPECPVTKAYLSLIVDTNAQVRTEVVKLIHSSSASSTQIINRLKDVDFNVRIAAYRRIADFSPKNFKIFERHSILNSGLTEDHPKTKSVFLENLMPKWLNVYNNNYVNFLGGLKLDADETDLENTDKLMERVSNLLCTIIPIDEIIAVLPLDETKVIFLDKLTTQSVGLWKNLSVYLRKNDSCEEYLEQILPDLTPFCHYIDRVVQENCQQKMEDWVFLDYQYILNNIFNIAEQYDLADEVGRNALNQLTLKLLRNEHFGFKLKQKIVSIASVTSQKTDDFTSVICHIISDIQIHFEEKQIAVNPDEKLNKECEIATITVKLIKLDSEKEEALQKEDYNRAEVVNKEMQHLRQQLQNINVGKPATEMVKVTKTDVKTVCECLELLIALLKLPSINKMTPSLITVKDEFVIPQLAKENSDINWRALECIALFSCMQESLAEEFSRILLIPIITYRTIHNYNNQALMTAINSVSDLFRLYGPNVFGCMNETMCGGSQTMNSTSTNKRRLYNCEEEQSVVLDKLHFDSIIEVMVDMLDDEKEEIRDTAMKALTKMIFNHLVVTPHLITRLILKWYNPLSGLDSLQQLIGVVINNYAVTVEGAKEVIAKAIIPIFQSIASAPATSPLADVNIDNLILFLSTITQSDGRRDLGNHLNMAHMFTYEILKTKNSVIILYLSKILVNLNVSTSNVTFLRELIAQVDATLEKEQFMDKTSKKNLLKFKEKLNRSLESQNTTMNTILEESNAQGDNTGNTRKSTDDVDKENSFLGNSNTELGSKNVEEARKSTDDAEVNKVNCNSKNAKRNRKSKSTSQSDSTTGDEEELSRIKKKPKPVVIKNLQIEIVNDMTGERSSANIQAGTIEKETSDNKKSDHADGSNDRQEDRIKNVANGVTKRRRKGKHRKNQDTDTVESDAVSTGDENKGGHKRLKSVKQNAHTSEKETLDVQNCTTVNENSITSEKEISEIQNSPTELRIVLHEERDNITKDPGKNDKTKNQTTANNDENSAQNQSQNSDVISDSSECTNDQNKKGSKSKKVKTAVKQTTSTDAEEVTNPKRSPPVDIISKKNGAHEGAVTRRMENKVIRNTSSSKSIHSNKSTDSSEIIPLKFTKVLSRRNQTKNRILNDSDFTEVDKDEEILEQPTSANGANSRKKTSATEDITKVSRCSKSGSDKSLRNIAIKKSSDSSGKSTEIEKKNPLKNGPRRNFKGSITRGMENKVSTDSDSKSTQSDDKTDSSEIIPMKFTKALSRRDQKNRSFKVDSDFTKGNEVKKIAGPSTSAKGAEKSWKTRSTTEGSTTVSTSSESRRSDRSLGNNTKSSDSSGKSTEIGKENPSRNGLRRNAKDSMKNEKVAKRKNGLPLNRIQSDDKQKKVMKTRSFSSDSSERQTRGRSRR